MITRKRVVAVFFASLALSPQSPLALGNEPTLPRTVQFDVAGGVAAAGTLVLEPVPRAAGGGGEARRLPFRSPTLQLGLPAGAWRARVEAAGFWAPELLWNVLPEHQGKPLVVPIFPAAPVRGKVQVLDRAGQPVTQLPEAVLLRFEPVFVPGKTPAFPRSQLSCPVSPGGSFVCPLPAGKLDLAVRLEGHAPVYRWGVSVAPPEPLELGVVTLEPGASLLASVVLAEGRLVPDQGLAWLVPVMADRSADHTTSMQLTRAEINTPVPADGRLVFSGVPPGVYALEVQYPGCALTRRAPIAVSPATEVRVPEPLVLQAPLTLRVSVSPA